MNQEESGTDLEDPITSSGIEGIDLSVAAEITTKTALICCPMPASRHDAQPHQPCNEGAVDCLSDVSPVIALPSNEGY